MEWRGYNKTATKVTVAIPPTWRDIPAILKGTYTPKVVELPREDDNQWRDCPPEFLLGFDGAERHKPSKRRTIKVGAKAADQTVNYVTYNIVPDKPKKKKRKPYKHEKPVGIHPALEALAKERNAEARCKHEKVEPEDIRVLVEGVHRSSDPAGKDYDPTPLLEYPV